MTRVVKNKCTMLKILYKKSMHDFCEFIFNQMLTPARVIQSNRDFQFCNTEGCFDIDVQHPIGNQDFSILHFSSHMYTH